MNILVNASNLHCGGGAQVADSICRYLIDYPQHRFYVILSNTLSGTAAFLSKYKNVQVRYYNCPSGDIKAFFSFKNKFLDNIVENENIDCVFTIFGPVKWRPRCRHISGFGLSHIVMPESPFFKKMRFSERLKWRFHIKIWEYVFYRSSDVLITENPLITERVKNKFRNKEVITITNNYNQVFDNTENQTWKEIPSFNGISLLDVTAFGPHKNTTIAIDIARILRERYPDFRFRFVFTFDKAQYPSIPTNLQECFHFTGRVSIEQCPSLYKQCDIEFQPTLLECFTATYPEAMRMNLPIVTTDLPFARGLCGEAAIYYDPLSAESAAKKIYELATDCDLRHKLIEAGRKQLQIFDSSKERANKSIRLCEHILGEQYAILK